MEQLQALGFTVTYSGLCPVSLWGKHIIHARHSAGGLVNGYGDYETAAILDAINTVNKRLAYVEPSIKVTH